MNTLRLSDPLFATPLESVVRRFLSSVQLDLPKKAGSVAHKIAIQ